MISIEKSHGADVDDEMGKRGAREMSGQYNFTQEDIDELRSQNNTNGISTCIGCGCDDDQVCLDEYTANKQPCSWIRVDRGVGIGVYSACPEYAARWDSGGKQLAAPAEPAHQDR